MIATAIGPQNWLRDSGIIASTDAAAVSRIGRQRRTAASTIADQVSTPRSLSRSIWSTRITELRMIMPTSAMTPSWATKPNGRCSTSRAAAAPMKPSGPVRKTSSEREKLLSCSISSVKMTNSASGTLAAIARPALSLSSAAPAITSR